MADEAEVKDVIDNEIEQEQDGFEADFNAAAEAREDTTTTESVGDAEIATDTAADEKPDDGVDKDAVTDDAGADKEKSAGKPDPYEGMSDAVKGSYQAMEKSNKDLQHRIDSDNGRVGALQRKINNLDHKIATIQEKPGQPSNKEITDAMKGGKDGDDWQKFEKDYPEVAGAINGRFEAEREQTNSKIDETNNTIAPVIEKQEQAAATEAEAVQTEAYSEVAKAFPTWQTAVQEDNFHNWMATQPPGTQALASSDDPRDASLLIGQYDDYRVANDLPTLRTDHVADDTVVENKADEVAQRRAQQLEDGVTIESKSARIDPSAESGSEFENAFDAFAARKDNKAQRTA